MNREPYNRRINDPANLPDGKGCGDCVFFPRCKRFIGANAADEVCDWIPIRFVQRDAEKESTET